MEYSAYNIYLHKENVVIIYNTLSNAIVQLDTIAFNQLSTDAYSELRKELFKQGILVKSHDGELYKYKYMQFSKMFRSDSILLYICPTINCNFSCSYCFESGNKRSGNMSEDVEDAIIEFLVKNKNKKISIVWFGGEPLLNVGTIERISQKLKQNDVSFSASMITNGSLLNERVVEILNDIPMEFVQISMDGTKHVHDSRRHFHSGAGSFDIVIKGIKNLVAGTSIPITIQLSIDKSNYKEYERLLDYFNRAFPTQMDANRIQLNYNIVKDRTDFDRDGVCMNHQDYFDFLIYTDKLCLKNKRPLSLPNMAQPCMYVSRGAYAVAPDGSLYKCIEHIGNKDKSVGNILSKEISLTDISTCFFNQCHMENSECLQCNVMPICGGGCPLDREADNGSNRISCSFYRNYIENILSAINL